MGVSMLTLGVLASTNGTDIDAVARAIKTGKLKGKARFGVLISNKRTAGALSRAKRKGIPTTFVDPAGTSREEYDRAIHHALKERKVDLVLLIGYMRYLSPWFVKQWDGRIMNIHPSLLPAFAGGMDVNVHEAVLARGCKVTGCTLHFVDEGADTGPIIIQRVIDVKPRETAASLKKRVQKEEGEALVQGIRLFAQGKLKIKAGTVTVS